MNSIDIIKSGRESYYLSHGKDSYYTSEANPSGEFCGKGAERLGILHQAITENDETLKSLFQGQAPDGTTLRKGNFRVRAYHTLEIPKEDGKGTTTLKINRYEAAQLKSKDTNTWNKRLQHVAEKHPDLNLQDCVKTSYRGSVAAYDNVFSAPKDVSILWALAPDKATKDTILSLHQGATKAALSYLETCTFIRQGKAGTTTFKADAPFALFTHTTSRENDPQLHTHAVLLNVGITKDGHSGALDGSQILKARYAAGMIYQNELRRGIETTLGLATQTVPFSKDSPYESFQIAGMSAKLREEFSRRSEGFKDHLNDKMTPKQKRAVILQTRKEKDTTISPDTLAQDWQQRAQKHRFTWRSLKKLEKQAPVSQRDLDRDITRLLAKRKWLTEHQLVTAAARVSAGKLSTKKLSQFTARVKEQYLSVHPQANKALVYSLNSRGHRVKNYRSLFATVQAIYKAEKSYAYKNKMALLLITGKISQSQYDRYTKGTGLPTSVLGIRVHQALGLISTKQANYLLIKNQKKSPTNLSSYMNAVKQEHRPTATSITIFPAEPQKQPEYTR